MTSGLASAWTSGEDQLPYLLLLLLGSHDVLQIRVQLHRGTEKLDRYFFLAGKFKFRFRSDLIES